MRRAVVLLASLSFTKFALPNGVGLDGRGCHHSRKAGGYHRHHGVMVGQSFASKDGVLEAMCKQGKPFSLRPVGTTINEVVQLRIPALICRQHLENN